MNSIHSSDRTQSNSFEMSARTMQDRSCYFLGLLLLVASDGEIVREEREDILEIAALLDFDPEYCTEVLESVFANQYIQKDPVKFTSTSAAKAFIEDGIRLALADGNFSASEKEWLESVAIANKIPATWLELIKKSAIIKNNREWSVAQWWQLEKSTPPERE